ncbi:hypothetical protein G6F68_016139 [Rhizopus microsporus]|nr:hypothetical protein G6F68_016139 [Rhizopus microsporus]
MQENRSFDHYFGTLKGVRGFGDRFTIPLANGRKVWQQERANGAVLTPYHLDGSANNAQRADGAGNRREHVRTRAGDDACRERGRVELVLGVQVQGDVHRLDPFVAGLFAVQQVQEVAADAVVVRLHVDDAAVVAVVVPVQQGRTQVGHQAVGDVARARGVVIVFLGQHAAQHRHGGAHAVPRLFSFCL